jgi:hypothetical protein
MERSCHDRAHNLLPIEDAAVALEEQGLQQERARRRLTHLQNKQYLSSSQATLATVETEALELVEKRVFNITIQALCGSSRGLYHRRVHQAPASHGFDEIEPHQARHQYALNGQYIYRFWFYQPDIDRWPGSIRRDAKHGFLHTVHML